jgi:phage terminase large subunit-like protein
MATKTKTPTSSSDPAEGEALARLTGWLGPVAGPALFRYLAADVDTRTGARRRPELVAEILDLQPPKWFSPPPSGEVVFSLPEVDRFLRFARTLRHIKGRKWARRPFELDLWQVVFVAAPLFGWLHEDDDGRLVRVYSTLYLEVPRKNGKSTLAAVIGLYLLTADREPGAEVYAAAADREQARAVYDVARKMAQGSPALRRRCRPNRSAIVVEATASAFKVLSADGWRKHGLNVHGSIVDELHVHKNRDMLETLETGTGSRTQPIVAIITTAGLDDPGSIYTERRDYAEKVAVELHTTEPEDPDNPDAGLRPLTGRRLDDDSHLSVIYTVDESSADPFAEPTWKTANPGYGRSLTRDYMVRQAKKAAASPAALNGFLRLHLNIRTGQIVRWLSMSKWDASGGRHLRPKESDLAGRLAYAGLDLASSTDLAALAVVLPVWRTDPDDPDRKIEDLDVVIRAWTPEATLDVRAERDRAPYRQWVRDGWLSTTPGEVIDYDRIEAEVNALVSELGLGLDLRRLHFDRWGSKQLIGHLRDEIGQGRVFEMGQGFASMSAPMKELEKLVLAGRLRHGANPLLRWAVGSLAVAVDAAENVKPDRDKSTGRIDPFVALVMAVDGWARDLRGRSVYEETEDDEEADAETA